MRGRQCLSTARHQGRLRLSAARHQGRQCLSTGRHQGRLRLSGARHQGRQCLRVARHQGRLRLSVARTTLSASDPQALTTFQVRVVTVSGHYLVELMHHSQVLHRALIATTSFSSCTTPRTLTAFCSCNMQHMHLYTRVYLCMQIVNCAHYSASQTIKKTEISDEPQSLRPVSCVCVCLCVLVCVCVYVCVCVCVCVCARALHSLVT
jgi:hypothetical protein